MLQLKLTGCYCGKEVVWTERKEGRKKKEMKELERKRKKKERGRDNAKGNQLRFALFLLGNQVRRKRNWVTLVSTVLLSLTKFTSHYCSTNHSNRNRLRKGRRRKIQGFTLSKWVSESEDKLPFIPSFLRSILFHENSEDGNEAMIWWRN